MAETKDQDETTLPAKRKPDPTSEDQADLPHKSQKLQLSAHPENLNSNCSLTEQEKQANVDPKVVEDEEDEEDYNEEVVVEEEEEDIEEAKVDGKGKGIMREDKGKGIMIEEEDEDDEEEDSSDDDSSSDAGSEFEDGDSDLSDDPLAEVDLDNILPSRTRRRQVQPGVYIRSDNNRNNNNNNNNNEEDDSDDSDGGLS